MNAPAIRVALTPNGDIEAATGLGVGVRRLVIDPRSRAVLWSDAVEGSDLFRWLVRAAREHAAPV